MRSTESAVNNAVQNATVVKNPNTFCALTKVECILLVERRDSLKSNTLQSARAGIITVLHYGVILISGSDIEEHRTATMVQSIVLHTMLTHNAVLVVRIRYGL